MSAARVLVVGRGSWGSRLRAKLEAMRVAVLPIEPMMADDAEWARAASWRPTHAIVAVPPSAHKGVALMLLESMDSLTDLRLEKPGCEDEDDLLDVLAAADVRDVQVSVGYTLAAHPAHCAVLDLVRRGNHVYEFDAWRVSTSVPAHNVSALLDLGSHAAFCAAQVGVGEARITAVHNAAREERWTRYRFEDFTIMVDEVAGVAVNVEARTSKRVPAFDAMRFELERFVDGAPLVMGERAIDAHRILAAQSLEVPA